MAKDENQKDEEQVAEVETVKEEGETQVESVEQAEGIAQTAEAVEQELEPEADELARLQEELEKARADAAEYIEGWQRARAEFSNYKKRQEADRAQMSMLASATLLRKLLPVVDDFERAMGTLPSELEQLTWCQGVFLIKLKLDGILESEGVKPIETVGEVFDPCYHEAVTYEEAPGYEDGQIIGEVQRGYILGQRVIRPALVRVAKAPASAPGKPLEKTECDDKE